MVMEGAHINGKISAGILIRYDFSSLLIAIFYITDLINHILRNVGVLKALGLSS